MAAVLCQPVGHASKTPDAMYDSGRDVWGPELCSKRPDVTMETVEQYLHNLYRIQPDFMYSVSRDFARSCQTPMLVMPDDTPSHSYDAAMDLVALAPKAQVNRVSLEGVAGHFREDDSPGARLPSIASTRGSHPLKACAASWPPSAPARRVGFHRPPPAHGASTGPQRPGLSLIGALMCETVSKVREVAKV